VVVVHKAAVTIKHWQTLVEVYRFQTDTLITVICIKLKIHLVLFTCPTYKGWFHSI